MATDQKRKYLDTTQVITSPLESEAALYHACGVTVLHGWLGDVPRPRGFKLSPYQLVHEHFFLGFLIVSPSPHLTSVSHSHSSTPTVS